jgi:hypothetical protein
MSDYQNKAGVSQKENPHIVRAGAGISLVNNNANGQTRITVQNDEAIVSAVSNGTTAVSVFGADGLPFPITITGVYLISRDTTATNITVEAPAATVVCTIAKGTVAGAVVGASSLSNTAVPADTNVILDGSGAGNAQVFITYRPA